MDLQNIKDAIMRTRMVAEMDNNTIRRQAKLDALRLAESDLIATFNHLQESKQ